MTISPWRTLAAAAICLLQSFSGPVHAGSLEWKVGLAQVKITPEHPVVLAGYSGRIKPFAKVECDLYAKALVLEDRQGHRAVVVTSDLANISGSFADQVCTQLREKTGLKREQILLSVSHNHSGPLLSLDPKSRGDIDVGDMQRTIEYTRQLQKRFVEVVVEAMKELQPAQLSWGSGVIDFAMNRREFTPEGVILGVNPRGPVDRTVPILRVDNADGELRAVLFGAAVHGTVLGYKNYDLCGDYGGFAQAFIEQKHPKAQAMFILGFAGDTNPYPRGVMETARAHGASLGKEVCRVLEAKLKPVRGPLTAAFARIALPLQDPPPRAELEELAKGKGDRARKVKRMLDVLDRNEKLPTEYVCPLAVWQFGEDLTLVGMSGEVVVDYVLLVEKALGPNKLWLSAYCNDVFGYLPSARVLEEGGYEAVSSGRLNLFAPKAQEVVVDKLRELAKQAGRKLPATPSR